MKVLVACEFSGIVRDAFAARGHDAWSCDLLPTERPGQHIQADVLTVFNDGWDLMIAFPPCTYLAYVSTPWLSRQPGRHEKMLQALEFFRLLLNAPIARLAIENPRGWAAKYIRKPDQVIQPYEFGHPMTKATCLWLENLPPLMASLIITDPFKNWTEFKVRKQADRSRTFSGVACAMAAQWGNYSR